MVQLSVDQGNLICEVEGMHKFWACKSRLEVPIEHVKAVHVRPEETRRWWHGWKIVGSEFPGVIAAGIFRLNGKWVFWDISNPDHAIEIELKDDAYDRLLIEVEDPEGAAQLIQSAIA
jgi:hypothetical protein